MLEERFASRPMITVAVATKCANFFRENIRLIGSKFFLAEFPTLFAGNVLFSEKSFFSSRFPRKGEEKSKRATDRAIKSISRAYARRLRRCRIRKTRRVCVCVWCCRCDHPVVTDGVFPAGGPRVDANLRGGATHRYRFTPFLPIPLTKLKIRRCEEFTRSLVEW